MSKSRLSSSDAPLSLTLNWLAAAVETDRILVHHRKANPEFEHPIEPLEDFYEVQFSVPAMAFVRTWLNSGPAFSLNLSASEWSEAFAYMAEIGFFTRTLSNDLSSGAYARNYSSCIASVSGDQG